MRAYIIECVGLIMYIRICCVSEHMCMCACLHVCTICGFVFEYAVCECARARA